LQLGLQSGEPLGVAAALALMVAAAWSVIGHVGDPPSPLLYPEDSGDIGPFGFHSNAGTMDPIARRVLLDQAAIGEEPGRSSISVNDDGYSKVPV